MISADFTVLKLTALFSGADGGLSVDLSLSEPAGLNLGIAGVGMRGPQGEQGEQGEPGPPGGLTLIANAGEVLGGHRAVMLDETGKAFYTSNTDPNHIGRFIGVTKTSAILDAEVEIVRSGLMIEGSWTWTPLQPVFLSGNGLLTQILPITGFLQVIGVALSATSLFVSARDPLIIN